MLIENQPEDLPTTNALDDVVDAEVVEADERAEIFLSGAHVATLDDAPRGGGRWSGCSSVASTPC